MKMEEGRLSLKWNNHQATLCNLLATVRRQDDYSDVTLACEGSLYPAHKLVLSSCSEYFAEIFSSLSNLNTSIIVVLKGVGRIELEYLLDYMYLGQVDVNQHELQNLVHSAEFLRVKGLALKKVDRGDECWSPPLVATMKRRKVIMEGEDQLDGAPLPHITLQAMRNNGSPTIIKREVCDDPMSSEDPFECDSEPKLEIVEDDPESDFGNDFEIDPSGSTGMHLQGHWGNIDGDTLGLVVAEGEGSDGEGQGGAGEKKYVCEWCQKGFRLSIHLKDHRRTHTGERPYQCGICHRDFTQRSNLRTHLNKIHKEQLTYLKSRKGRVCKFPIPLKTSPPPGGLGCVYPPPSDAVDGGLWGLGSELTVMTGHRDSGIVPFLSRETVSLLQDSNIIYSTPAIVTNSTTAVYSTPHLLTTTSVGDSAATEKSNESLSQPQPLLKALLLRPSPPPGAPSYSQAPPQVIRRSSALPAPATNGVGGHLQVSTSLQPFMVVEASGFAPQLPLIAPRPLQPGPGGSGISEEMQVLLHAIQIRDMQDTVCQSPEQFSSQTSPKSQNIQPISQCQTIQSPPQVKPRSSPRNPPSLLPRQVQSGVSSIEHFVAGFNSPKVAVRQRLITRILASDAMAAGTSAAVETAGAARTTVFKTRGSVGRPVRNILRSKVTRKRAPKGGVLGGLGRGLEGGGND